MAGGCPEVLAQPTPGIAVVACGDLAMAGMQQKTFWSPSPI